MRDQARRPVEPPGLAADLHVAKVLVGEAVPAGHPVRGEADAPGRDENEDQDGADVGAGGRAAGPVGHDGKGCHAPVRVVEAGVVVPDAEAEDDQRGGNVGERRDEDGAAAAQGPPGGECDGQGRPRRRRPRRRATGGGSPALEMREKRGRTCGASSRSPRRKLAAFQSALVDSLTIQRIARCGRDAYLVLARGGAVLTVRAARL